MSKPKSISEQVIAVLTGTIEASIEHAMKMEGRIKVACAELENLKGQYRPTPGFSAIEDFKREGLFNALTDIQNILEGKE